MMVSRLKSRSTMIKSLHPTTRRLFLRGIAILAAAGCIATLFLSESEDETLWKSLITEMGEGFDHIANAPVDPSMN